MKLPRNLTGRQLAKLLEVFGYQVVRQTGSPIRLTTTRNGEHHITVPAHNPLKAGTLAGILGEAASHLGVARREIQEQLFG